MKLMILSILTSAFAMPAAFAADCPASTKLTFVCSPTMAKGDSIFAAEVFDSVGVCAGKDQSFLLLAKGDQAEAVPAVAITRFGASTYTISDNGVDATFTVTTGIHALEDVPAKLTITMTAAKLPPASSHYTCAIK